MLENWPQVAVGATAILAGVLAFVVDRTGVVMAHGMRHWVLAFPTAAFAAISFLIADATGGAWWAVAGGNVCMVLAWGLVWSGCRAFNGRSSWVAVVILGGLIALLATAVPTPYDLVWEGDLARCLLIAAFNIASAIEFLRATLRPYPIARIGGVLFVANAVFSLVQAGIPVVGGPGAAELTSLLTRTVNPLFEGVCAAVGVVSILVLQRQLQQLVDRVPDPDRPVSARSFARRVLSADRGTVILMGLSLYSRLRVAYGGPQARTLQHELLDAAHDAAPAGAVVGDLGDGRVGVLVAELAPDQAVPLRQAIRRGFERRRREDELDIGIRLLDLSAPAADPGVLDTLAAEMRVLEVDEPRVDPAG